LNVGNYYFIHVQAYCRPPEILVPCINELYTTLYCHLTGLDGTGTHEPNSVLSMIHRCLQNYGFGEKGLYLHADNCGGKSCFCINLCIKIFSIFID
jgi:hypothetical protein